MSQKQLSIYLLILLLWSCANPIKIEERLEQTYNFSSVMYIDYKESDYSRNKSMTGSIEFGKKDVTILMNEDGKINKELFNIKTVTYSSSPTDLKYRTYQGDFSVTLRHDTIIEVTFYSGAYLMTFNKAKDKVYVNNKLPIPIPEPDINWTRIEIENVGTIDLSPKLEIQAGEYKEIKLKIKDKAQEVLGYKFSEPTLILQPKGINQFSDESLQKYCRVMIETIDGEAGEFPKINEKIILTSQEIIELDKEFKNQIPQAFANTPLRLIEWFPVKIDEINGMSCIHTSYTRQFRDQPFVMVDMYRFFNYDRIHSLTISYRILEKDYWIPTLIKTLNSFRITKII